MLSRRSFLQLSALAGCALLIPDLEADKSYLSRTKEGEPLSLGPEGDKSGIHQVGLKVVDYAGIKYQVTLDTGLAERLIK